MKPIFNMKSSERMKIAQAKKGFWTGVEAFAILAKHHPRAADIIPASHALMSQGLFGTTHWHHDIEGNINGFVVYHAEDYKPVMMVELSYDVANETAFVNRITFGRTRDTQGRVRPDPDPEFISAAAEALESTLAKNGVRMCAETECPVHSWRILSELKAGRKVTTW
jgi:hypothetical protein